VLIEVYVDNGLHFLVFFFFFFFFGRLLFLLISNLQAGQQTTQCTRKQGTGSVLMSAT
jgi:hypothetical protein